MMMARFLSVMVLASVLTTQADTLTWVGAAGADWNTASNWSPAKVPTAADDVLFTGDASPSMTAADASAGNVKVSSGTVSITGNKVFRLNGTGGTGIIDVADGAAMTIGPAFYGNSDGAIVVKKMGKGTFTFNNNVSYYVDSVEVAEGTVQLGTGVGGDGFNPVGALVTVRADTISALWASTR